VRQYLASITFADRQVGKLLDALDASPRAAETVIVLWSDHGWHLGEKGHWHKRTLWEVATRVPYIIVAPGRGKPGQTCARPVSTIDLFPSLIELCALPRVDGLDGKSLVSLLDDPTAPRRPAVTVDENRHVAVRGDRFRYIRYKDGTEELYDHQNDPNEWNNLATDPGSVPVKERLAKAIPSDFAASARTKKAYDFDPHRYRWVVKKTGEVIEGGNCELFPQPKS
jgi:arylsulfatase A-like enzyme